MKNKEFPNNIKDFVKKTAKVALIGVLGAIPTDASEDITQVSATLKNSETNQSIETNKKEVAPAVLYGTDTVSTDYEAGVLIENSPKVEPENPDDDDGVGNADDDKDVVSVENPSETVSIKNTPETKLAPEVEKESVVVFEREKFTEKLKEIFVKMLGKKAELKDISITKDKNGNQIISAEVKAYGCNITLTGNMVNVNNDINIESPNIAIKEWWGKSVLGIVKGIMDSKLANFSKMIKGGLQGEVNQAIQSLHIDDDGGLKIGF